MMRFFQEQAEKKEILEGTKETKDIEELEVQVGRDWVKKIPESTEILYIAIGCGDYTHDEKRVQAFPEFIRYAIDEAIKQKKNPNTIKIIAVDIRYNANTLPPGYPPDGAKKFSYHASALRSFLNKNPQYKKNILIYYSIDLCDGSDFIENYIKKGNQFILANFTGDDGLAVNPLIAITKDKDIVIRKNVHYLTHENLETRPDLAYDNEAYYNCGNLEGVVISLKSPLFPNKNMLIAREEPKNSSITPRTGRIT